MQSRREIKTPNIFAIAAKESMRLGYVPDNNLVIMKERTDGRVAATKISLSGLYGMPVRKRVAKSIVKDRVKKAVRNLEHFVDDGPVEMDPFMDFSFPAKMSY